MWLVHIVVAAWASVALALDRVTVLIVLDGFRHDYLNATFHAPNMIALSSSGVLVPRLKPVFPASRLANLASLITGAYSEAHNVIDDHEVFDAQLNRTLNASEALFWSGVRELGSIWDVSEGDSSLSSVVLGCPKCPLLTNAAQWPESPAQNSSSASAEGNSAQLDPETRFAGRDHLWSDKLLQNVSDFLSALATSPASSAFLTVMADEPGSSARRLGPNSAGMLDVILQVDEFVGNVLASVKAARLETVTNVIVVSTPGVAEVSSDKIVRLDKYTARNFTKVGTSPVYNIRPKENADSALALFSDLQRGQARKEYQVFSRDALPSRWHYKNSSHVQSIVLVANAGYFLAEAGDAVPGGSGGYDNEATDMLTPLMALGPAFASSLHSDPVNATHEASMVDVYALLCHVLAVDSCPTRSGSLQNLMFMLSDPPDHKMYRIAKRIANYVSDPEHLPVTVTVLIATLVVVLSMMCVLMARKKYKRLLREQQGYSYSQVRRNRRDGGEAANPRHDSLLEEDSDDGDSEDRQKLLSAAATEQA